MNSAATSILVVEDNDEIAFLLDYVLKRQGYAVERLGDGKAALARLSGSPPDAVILDVMLPHADGFEILASLRRTDRWQQVPVLMLTAKSAEKDISRGLDGGADDYLSKPFKPEELAARMRRLLR